MIDLFLEGMLHFETLYARAPTRAECAWTVRDRLIEYGRYLNNYPPALVSYHDAFFLFGVLVIECEALPPGVRFVFHGETRAPARHVCTTF